MSTVKRSVLIVSVALLPAARADSDVAEKVRTDAQRHEPLVAHVVVALCDNVHQGIVPVPKALGNGQDPGRNLLGRALVAALRPPRRAASVLDG